MTAHQPLLHVERAYPLVLSRSGASRHCPLGAPDGLRPPFSVPSGPMAGVG